MVRDDREPLISTENGTFNTPSSTNTIQQTDSGSFMLQNPPPPTYNSHMLVINANGLVFGLLTAVMGEIVRLLHKYIYMYVNLKLTNQHQCLLLTIPIALLF